MREDWWPWLMRAVWLSLPFTAGPGLGDALADEGRAVQITATTGLWVLWGLALLLTLVPHTTALTPLRIIAPGGAVAAAVATIHHGASTSTVVALACTTAAGIISLAPQIAAWHVNGSSYGDERRIPLRPPGPLLLGPIEVAWSAVVATVLAGPLLLASGHWVWGPLVVAVGGVASAVAVRALHSLARRWLVFVPAGLVVHDLMAMGEPVLFARTSIERFGPALAGSDAVDLTMTATGLALEVRSTGPVEIALRRRPRSEPEVVEVSGVLVSAARPGVVLDEAERRRIRVG